MSVKSDNDVGLKAATIQRNGVIIAAVISAIAILVSVWLANLFDSQSKLEQSPTIKQKKYDNTQNNVPIETLTSFNELSQSGLGKSEVSIEDILPVTNDSQEIKQSQFTDENVTIDRHVELENLNYDSKEELNTDSIGNECWATLKSRIGISQTIQYYDSPNELLESNSYDLIDGKKYKVIKFLRNREKDWYQIANLQNNTAGWVIALNISLDSNDKCNFLD